VEFQEVIVDKAGKLVDDVRDRSAKALPTR
jgi:hypothetical protein